MQTQQVIESTQISWDDFVNTYHPISNHISNSGAFDGFMFEKTGTELQYINTQPHNRIWTVIEVDSEDDIDETMFIISSGYHFVNSLGYIVTTKNWEHECLEVLDT